MTKNVLSKNNICPINNFNKIKIFSNINFENKILRKNYIPLEYKASE